MGGATAGPAAAPGAGIQTMRKTHQDRVYAIRGAWSRGAGDPHRHGQARAVFHPIQQRVARPIPSSAAPAGRELR